MLFLCLSLGFISSSLALSPSPHPPPPPRPPPTTRSAPISEEGQVQKVLRIQPFNDFTGFYFSLSACLCLSPSARTTLC
ncbi:unnamed protein product [Closterium sp. NIES-53]